MASEVYFENTHSGKRYKVLKIDKEKGTITLKGAYEPFEEPYDPKRFAANGYKPVKVETEDDEDAVSA